VKSKILVVDDNRDVCRTVANMLGATGARIKGHAPRRCAYAWRLPSLPRPSARRPNARPMPRRRAVRPGVPRGVRYGAPTGAGFLAAAVILVDSGPSALFGFFFRHATSFVALRDMVRLAFLLIGVFGLVAARHGVSLPIAK